MCAAGALAAHTVAVAPAEAGRGSARVAALQVALRAERLYAHATGRARSWSGRVATGAPIGRVGASGRTSGPHLHFEARRRGAVTDPLRALR